jgi:hypothetical protein
VIEKFFAPGWKHERVEFELAKSARLSRAGRAGGVASGAARGAEPDRSMNDGATIVERSAERSGNDAPTISEALQSPSEVKPKAASLRRACPIPPDWQPDREFACRKSFCAGEIDSNDDAHGILAAIRRARDGPVIAPVA